MISDADKYRDELEALLTRLDAEAHEDKRIQRIADFLAEKGYAEDEICFVVMDSSVKGMSKKEAQGFAERVRKRFLWHPARRKS